MRNYHLLMLLLSSIMYININSMDNNRVEIYNSQQECTICLEDRNISFYWQLHCGHKSSCSICLMQLINLAIKEQNDDQIRCPEQACNQPINITDIRKIISMNSSSDSEYRNIILLYQNIATKRHLSNNSHIRHCPTPNCTNQFENINNIAKIFECDLCNKTYCSNCLHPHSSQVTCKEATIQKNSETANEKWIQKNTQNCPNCKTSIEKNQGCNHMICTKCKYEFCWICSKIWSSHGNNYYNCPNNNQQQLNNVNLVNEPVQVQQDNNNRLVMGANVTYDRHSFVRGSARFY